MRVIDEAWFANGASVCMKAPDTTDTVTLVLRSSRQAGDYKRVRLAAAAPQLARALLAAEWGARRGLDGACPDCRRTPHDGHAADCALDAALRAAGVR